MTQLVKKTTKKTTSAVELVRMKEMKKKYSFGERKNI